MVLTCSLTVWAEADQTLRASLTVDRDQAYPGEQILITFTISAPASAFSITHDLLTLSSAGDASGTQNKLLPVRQEKFNSSEETLTWQNIRTTYALFATSEGEMTVNPVTVRATLPVTANSGQRTNPKVNVTTPTRTIQIQPLPIVDKTWLAANHIVIESEWSTDETGNTTFTAGEPTTRTIKIIADSQQAAAIPRLAMRSTDNLKIYPGNAHLETAKEAQGITGTRYEVMTLLPVTAGEKILPAIALDWWDINNKQWKKTVLPAETILVKPSQRTSIQENGNTDFFQRLALLLGVACLALLVCCVWLTTLLKRQNHVAGRGYEITERLTEKSAWNQLQQSLSSEKPGAFRVALKVWLSTTQGELRYDTINSQEPELNQILNDWEKNNYAADQPKAGSASKLPRQSRETLRKILRRIRAAHLNTPLARTDKKSTQSIYPSLHRSR